MGKQTVVLEAQQAVAVKALVLRGGGTGTSTLIEVTGLRAQPVMPPIPKERGFLTKDAIDDLAGKVAGAWVSAPYVDVQSSDLAAFLMPPGVLAVAFALNFSQILPAGSAQILLATVAAGTAAFELFALAVVPHWRKERTA